MKISIDAITLKSGGAKKHLEGMLANIDENSEFKYLVWVSYDSTFTKYRNKSIEIIKINKFYSSFLGYIFWQIFLFEIKSFLKGSKILFIPSGLSLTYPFRLKKVSIFRNMLFEEVDQIFLYDLKNIIILLIKKLIHEYTILTSDCYVCLNKFAKRIIQKKTSRSKFLPIISHSTKSIKEYSDDDEMNNKYSKIFDEYKINIFYPSHFSPYKNQHLVIKEFDKFINSIKIRNKKYIGLHLAGKKSYPYYLKVRNNINSSSYRENIHIYDEMPQKTLLANMKKANMLIFASSCENHPNLLLEMIQINSNIICHEKNIFKSEFGKYVRFFNINKKGSLSEILYTLYLEYLKNNLKEKRKIPLKEISFSENLRNYEKIFSKIAQK